MKIALSAMFGLTVALAAVAQEAPIVTVEVSPEEVAVGEPLRLRVKVLGPTWFPLPPQFPSFEITNAIVRLPPDSSRATSERIGRETWTGVVRNYQVYPLMAANFRLDGLTLAVTYADPGKANRSANVDVPPIEFRAVVPVGAESLSPYISGRSFTLSREIEGETEGIQRGDALVVRYTAELDGLPAVFLPNLLEESSTPGVSVYLDSPVVEDGVRARRSEKATFVFAAGGDYELPELTLRWWNTATSAIEIASIDAMTVSVLGPPLPAEPGTAIPEPRRWLPILASVLLLLLLIGMLRHPAAVFRSRWVTRRERYRASEAYAFRRLQAALNSGDARVSYNALLNWLQLAGPDSTPRQFAEACDSADLLAAFDELSGSLYSRCGHEPNLKVIARRLAAARRRCLRKSGTRTQSELPSLNPE